MQYRDMLYYNDVCGHVFHEKCMIKAMLALNSWQLAVCPMCRAPLPDEDFARLTRDNLKAFEIALTENDVMTLGDIFTTPGYNINALQYQFVERYVLSGNISPLMFAISNKATPKVVKFMLSVNGIDVNTLDGYGRTALIFAAAGEDSEVVKLLLSAGADVNARTNGGETALMKACEYEEERDGSSFEIVEVLLATPGIDVNAVDTRGESALVKVDENEDVLRALLAAEAIKVNAAPGANCSAKSTKLAPQSVCAPFSRALLGRYPRAQTFQHLACVA
jgi:hypothetical protein